MASIEKNIEKINKIQQNINEINAKVYGMYPGNIENFIGNIKIIDALGEFELFMFISSLTNYLNALKQVASFNTLEVNDIKETIYALEYMVSKTEKFGVILEKDNTGRLSSSEDYINWYKFHSNYFSKTLSKEELQKFLELKSRGYSLSRYLPDSSYIDYKTKENLEKNNIIKYRRTSKVASV